MGISDFHFREAAVIGSKSCYDWSMPKLAVRCCCQPTKIIGYLDLSTDCRRPGHVVVRERAGTATAGWRADPKVLTPSGVHTVRLELFCVASLAGDVHRELAVYSDDRPIDFWRNIRGFREYYGPPAPDHRWSSAE